MRHSLFLLILLLLALIIAPFLFLGDRFETALSLEGARAWMEQYGPWAWAAGIVLIIGDLVLPIPATVVMSSLGWMYGWFWGGLVAAGGSVLSGLTGYALCRWFGHRAALWIAGESGLRKGEELFEKGGGWLVVLSRWAPVLPEAVACLAGLVRMPWPNFVIALVCGSLPLGFAFAAIGALGHGNPRWAIGLSAVVPIALWLIARRILRNHGDERRR